MRLGWVCVALVFIACTKSEPAPTAVTSASAEPAVEAKPSDDDGTCFSPEESMKHAKPRGSAEAPYSECAGGVFSHCPPNDAYCSIALSVERTKNARAAGKKLCCYGK
jgi:hypothetical protein